MPNIRFAFLGYRKEWERDWVVERALAAVEVLAILRDPADTLQERGREFADQADVLACWGYNVEDIHLHPGNLKLVQSLASGTNHVPKIELHKLGIPTANNGGTNSIAVAEITVMLIVAAMRQLAHLLSNLEEGRYNAFTFDTWEEYSELSQKRVGIVGLGNIGTDVARRLAGWDCEIVFFDQREIDPARQRECRATSVSFEELLETSDVVTVHTPLTDKTRAMIGRDEIALMKPTAVLVNTCRGTVVDEAALIDALQSGAIAGAGLDVTEVEPIAPDNPLMQMENVFLTPHVAGLSVEARQKSLAFAVENANRLAEGHLPLGIVDPFE